MSARLRHGIASLLAAAALAGCGGSAPSRFYTLDSTASAAGAADARLAIVVGTVSVPASVDRPQMVVQLSPNQVQIDEFNRWAAPLDDAIGRVIAGDLAALLGTADVVSGPVANFVPTHRVTIDVQRFESTPGQFARIDAVWTVQAANAAAARSGRSIAQEAASDASYDALAAAHSRALAKVSADIASAIRAESAEAR
jgi:uncharacterized lipoprotein YmbA